MRSRLLAGALALVAATNAVVLAGVAWNRAEPADATLVLTERELGPHGYGRDGGENTGIALTLRYAYGELAWFDDDKLRAIGYEPSDYPPNTHWKERKEPLPRLCLAVLEYDGPAWAERLREKEAEEQAFPDRIAAGKATTKAWEQARDELERMRIAESRLVPVDVGTDADALRARYPDRGGYLITPVEVRFVPDRRSAVSGAPPPARGHIARILTNPIHLPIPFHAAYARATASVAEKRAPRYEVTVNYGRRHEPWVTAFAGIADRAD